MKTIAFFKTLIFLIIAVPNYAQKLVADNVDYGDFLGYSVAVSGSRAIAGAYYDDNISRGNLSKAGAAYLFTNNGAGFATTAKLTPDVRQKGAWFGHSVDIFGATALIGSPNDRTDADNQNVKSGSGAAYIFQDDGAGMEQFQKIVPNDRASSTKFGWAVAIDGTLAVVSAPQRKNYNDAGEALYGSVYVFKLNTANNEYEQLARIDAPEISSIVTSFGNSVDINGTTGTIVVGTERNSRDAGGVGDSYSECGAIYIFTRNADGTSWTYVRKVVAPNRHSRQQFGKSVSISGNLIAIGAPGEKNAAGHNIGAFYVYNLNNNNFITGAGIQLATPKKGDLFGQSVSLAGSTVVVGAPWRDLPRPTNPNATFNATGASYVYNIDVAGGAIALTNTLIPTGYNGGETMGWSVATDGNSFINGAYSETVNHSATGQPVSSAGAVFIF